MVDQIDYVYKNISCEQTDVQAKPKRETLIQFESDEKQNEFNLKFIKIQFEFGEEEIIIPSHDKTDQKNINSTPALTTKG